MSLTVFTCTIGPTDPVRRPTVINPDVRYICLSDGPVGGAPPPYRHVQIPRPSGDRACELLSRQIKILANHPSLGTPDLTLWHDAAYRLDVDPAVVVDELADHDVLAFAHPHRSQIADEAVQIARLGYVAADVLERQVQAYRTAGFTQAAISSTGFCLRRTSPAVARFNIAWWAEVVKWGWRDQMSVDYAAWMTNVDIGYIPGHYKDNPYATWYPDRRVRA